MKIVNVDRRRFLQRSARILGFGGLVNLIGCIDSESEGVLGTALDIFGGNLDFPYDPGYEPVGLGNSSNPVRVLDSNNASNLEGVIGERNDSYDSMIIESAGFIDSGVVLQFDHNFESGPGHLNDDYNIITLGSRMRGSRLDMGIYLVYLISINKSTNSAESSSKTPNWPKYKFVNIGNHQIDRISSGNAYMLIEGDGIKNLKLMVLRTS